MTYQEFRNKLKDGDTLTIKSNPLYWSSGCGGIPGTNLVEYPYTFKIEKFHLDDECFISIKDTNGYGWSIDTKTSVLFKLENREINIGDKVIAIRTKFHSVSQKKYEDFLFERILIVRNIKIYPDGSKFLKFEEIEDSIIGGGLNINYFKLFDNSRKDRIKNLNL